MTLRQEKVSKLIQKLAAEFLESESNRTSLITVTGSNVSSDLRSAEIFITVLPIEAEQDALNFVKRKRSDLRDYLRKKTKMRNLPFVDFVIDQGEKHRQKIDEISNKY